MIGPILRKFKPRLPKELARRDLLDIKLKESDIAIDCGANVGNITKHLCNSGATVYAFEPNPYAYQVLQERFLKKPNVHCIQKGVLDCNDKMRLYLHEFSNQDQIHWSTGSSLLDFKNNVLMDKYVEIEVVDLCEFIDSLKYRIKLLKMDVEGAEEGVECRILKKLINTGQIRKIDYVFVETHEIKIPELKSETEEIRNLLKERKIRNVNLDWN